MMKCIRNLLIALSFVSAFFILTDASALPIGAGFPPGAMAEGTKMVFLQYQNFALTENGGNSQTPLPGFGTIVGSKANINVYAVIMFETLGFGGRLTAFQVLPYLHKSLGTTAGFGTVPFGLATNGLADPIIGFQYVWFKKTWGTYYMGAGTFMTWILPLGTYTWTGANIPAGASFTPRAFAPGGGNWVPTFGFSYLLASPKFDFAIILSYGLPLEARGYKAGNVFNYAMTFSYVVLPWKFKTLAEPAYVLKLVFEVIGTSTGRIKTNNVPRDTFNGGVQNTGGNVVRVAPGLELGWGKTYSVSLSYQFPVIQSFNGLQILKQHHQIIVIFAHGW